ncbi:MAG: DUF4981 domain-containing protein [Eubacterium sp.]|nr:DUF4981 domain-containing protein [Eubacterium sp.]
MNRISEFDQGVIEDRRVFQQNRLPAHAEFETFCRLPLDSSPDGLAAEAYVSNRILDLDGEWCFSYAERPADVTEGFEESSFDCFDWERIQVPGHIQMQGYDRPQYTNTAYPWDGREDLARGEVPKEFNPVGEYVKYFSVPEEWEGKTLRLSFQGVESGAAVWLNGEYIGYFENSFNPAEFDITSSVKTGLNKLAVRVFKWVAGSWCEDQDFFRFSGIYRSVYIYYVPEVHLEDIRICPELDDAYRDGVLRVDARLNTGGGVRLTLVDSAGGGETVYQSEVTPAELVDTTDDVAAGVGIYDSYECEETYIASLTSPKISAPHLWSAETPYLYTLYIEVLSSEGAVVEKLTQKLGFRRFEMKYGLMCINGKRIVFKGVNRHEFSSRTGRIVSEDELIRDIVTMKRNNINAIRTCHYPDDVRIYDLCDRYGLYLIAENNMETHGTWIVRDTAEQIVAARAAAIGEFHDGTLSKEDLARVVPGDDLSWEPMLLDRVNSCFQRDKNHPSILIWSIGNESFGGPVLQHMTDRFHKLDPGRLVHYEGIFHDRRYPGTSDMESRMYPSVEEIEKYLEEEEEKPFICCEYTHAMGNSCGGMHKYTDLSEREPRYQGGFIWDYIDQSLWAKNRYGEDYQAYGGDFGDRPSSYEFSGNGIVYGDDRTPSPKMQEVRYNYQSIFIDIKSGSVKVRNLNLFINTKVYDCYVEYLYNGRSLGEVKMETDVPPLSEKDYDLPFFGEYDAPGEYSVTIRFLMKTDTLWCERGHVVAVGQKTWKNDLRDDEPIFHSKFISEIPIASVLNPLQIIPGDENLGVKGDDFFALFSGDRGGLVLYEYKGHPLIGEVPRPNFWRAPTDNDRGARSEKYYAQWKLASLYQEHRTEEYMLNAGPDMSIQEDGSVFLRFVYYLATSPVAKVDVRYHIFPDGKIKMGMDYDPEEGLPEMPEFGFLFRLDAGFDRVEWYGLGPEETYADRKRGGLLGVYRNRVSDNMARYLVPQECGNKEEVRYLRVLDEEGRGLVFAGNRPMSASALPYTPHQLEEARHLYELPPVHHTIVRVSKAQMGVGGDDSWGAKVHPEYRLDVRRPLHFEVTFQGISD